ncbi:hypothetical protein Nmel_013072 [Mimus melanotis]
MVVRQRRVRQRGR